MTIMQISLKIESLEKWLVNNQYHHDYQIILKDKNELETILKEYDSREKHS